MIRLFWETSPRLAVLLGLFIVADGVLPNLALVALGRAVGRIPAAVEDGLGSPAGHALMVALALGTGAYALSLLRSPAEDLLAAHTSAAMSAAPAEPPGPGGLRARPGSSTWRTRPVLDQLSSASGELSTSRPADAPMALASAFGDRLGGLLACVVIGTFRWYLGLMFFVGWCCCGRRCGGCWLSGPCWSGGPPRTCGTAGTTWAAPTGPPSPRRSGSSAWGGGSWAATGTSGWPAWRRRGRRCAGSGTGRCCSASASAVMYAAGAGAVALAAWNHDIALGTVAVLLPMLPSTMQVGGVTAADVALEQMLAAVPDLDDLLARLQTSLRPARPRSCRRWPACRPAARRRGCRRAGRQGIRFEAVGYRYPGGGAPVYEDLDLDLAAGQSLALVASNGAGKTTLVTLLARLREPGGRTDHRRRYRPARPRRPLVAAPGSGGQPGLRPLPADRPGERRLP